ncbi:UDP-2,4-diacetamido-2,4,6-trideoxy-beta-L-altropyranose hydrolase [Shewanella morhuae]|uniref:Spore coat polysaccharide biosynthesis protein, predicted glycosyltransferase n=1 Tax=Shewanella morhuae TaxID=365591 RepID=A0A380A832_9GAMM|nr:UDP-2,4-diacetamido-2,4,6-trideoxy-beta-L-altropyranose hydrolase [Shewanella morhuae]SUI75975.1 Spore coat polysaccharide biosynthesis protein, predicted glycosyltransferase [Shewanella morhuae]
MVAFLLDKARIVFYGNSSQQIGAGHIMRLFALAQAAQTQFEVVFAYKSCTDVLLHKLHQQGFSTHSINSPLNTHELMLLKPTVLVVDDYYLVDSELDTLKNLDVYLVKLDDGLNNAIFFADLIINPAPNAPLDVYKRHAPTAMLCLGPQYTYLRQEFSRCNLIPVEERKNLLITLGGTDSKSLALPLSKLLLDCLPQVQIQLLLGKTHQHQLSLKNLQKKNTCFHLICNPESVAEIMSRSGLAISAAGGTLGELASMGVPTLALITVDNQLPALTSPLNNTWYHGIDVRNFNDENGDISQNRDLLNKIREEVLILWHNTCKRVHMGEQARQLVDTKGCQRIIEQLMIGINNKLGHQ